MSTRKSSRPHIKPTSHPLPPDPQSSYLLPDPLLPRKNSLPQSHLDIGLQSPSSTASTTPPTSPQIFTPPGVHNAPQNTHFSIFSDAANDDPDPTLTRAGSLFGETISGRFALRDAKVSRSWAPMFLTYNSTTSSLLQFDKPGTEPVAVYEVVGVVNVEDRMFRRKCRLDVLLSGGMVSLAAESGEMKKKLLEAVRACCSGGGGDGREKIVMLRSDMARESRKVIALTTQVETWKTRYKEVNRKGLVEGVKTRDRGKSTGVGLLARWVEKVEKRDLGRAWGVWKTHTATKMIRNEESRMRAAIMITATHNKGTSRMVNVAFTTWFKFTHQDAVKEKVAKYEQGETLRVAKEVLGGNVSKMLDIVGDVRRMEIEVMLRELEAIDAERALEEAMGRQEEDAKFNVEKLLEEAVVKAYGQAREELGIAESKEEEEERRGREEQESESSSSSSSSESESESESESDGGDLTSPVKIEIKKIERNVKRYSIGGSSMDSALSGIS